MPGRRGSGRGPLCRRLRGPWPPCRSRRGQSGFPRPRPQWFLREGGALPASRVPASWPRPRRSRPSSRGEGRGKGTTRDRCRANARELLEFPVDADDFPGDAEGRGAGGNDDRRKRRVGRFQPHLPLPEAQPLDRGLAVDHGHNDLPVLGACLHPDEDVVSIADVGIGHAVTLHAQGEDLPIPQQSGIEKELPLDLFDRLPGRAGGDPAQDGNAYRGAGQGLAEELDPPRGVGPAPDVPLALQEVEVVKAVLHGDPEILGDLLRRGGEPMACDEILEERQDLLLCRGKVGSHVCILVYIHGEWKSDAPGREKPCDYGRGTMRSDYRIDLNATESIWPKP